MRSAARYWYVLLPILFGGAFLAIGTYVYAYSLTPDVSAYSQVAEYYATFAFDKALNGYWSPLLSWLIVPAFWFNIEPIIWIRIINVTGAIILMTLLAIIAYKVKPRTTIEKIAIASILFCVAVTLSIWSFRYATPDFLSGVVAVALILVGWWYIKRPSIRRGIILGLFAGLLFFAKAAAITISVVVLIVILVRLHAKWRRIHRYWPSYVAAVAVFSILVAGWSTVTYIKYGVAAPLGVASINFELVGPEARQFHQIDRVNTFLSIPYSDGSSVWDDPTLLSPAAVQSGDLPYYAERFLGNVFSGINILLFTSPLLIICILFLWWRGGQYRFYVLVALAASWAVLLVAYSVLLMDIRYFYVLFVPLIIFGGIAGIPIITRIDVQRYAKILFVILILSSAVVTAWSSLDGYRSAMYSRSVYDARAQLVGAIPQNSRVAIQSLNLLSYCNGLNVQCAALNYKLGGNTVTDGELVNQMKVNQVKYYITNGVVYSDALELIKRYTTTPRTCIDAALRISKCARLTVSIYRIP